MFTDFAESQAVLLFAGGSGITFAASVFEELIHQAIQGALVSLRFLPRTRVLTYSLAGESRTRLITIVWYVAPAGCSRG